jgi:hypothetical protein
MQDKSPTVAADHVVVEQRHLQLTGAGQLAVEGHHLVEVHVLHVLHVVVAVVELVLAQLDLKRDLK